MLVNIRSLATAWVTVLGLALCAQASAAARQESLTTSTRSAIDSAVGRMKPCLVRIHVVSTEYREGREVKMQAVGSGAIITEDGYLVTNHHVAGHGARMVCTLWNREEIEADLVGTDPLTDIAVLKLRPETPRKFVAAKFGDSTRLQVGDAVLAMGSPMALSQSVTLGILSNLEMTMPRFFSYSGLRLDGEDVGSLVRWLGHDAAIYGGNSGGPLVNLQGEIIGINEIQFGLSGAIPGNLAHAVAQELIRHGRIQRSWIGIDAQPLFKHSHDTHGVLVGGVIEDSPASAAGLQTGDLILSVGDKPITVRYSEEMPQFMQLITGLPLGRETRIQAMRAGKEMSFTVVPRERGEIRPRERELKQWGITVRNISFLTAREMKRTNQAGVLITSVRPGGPGGEAKPSFARGDIITEVNGSALTNVEQLVEFTRATVEGKTEPVPVMAAFDRDAERYLTVIKVGIQELRDPGLEVSKAWLPVETHVISRDIAKALGRADLKGFYITQVYPHSTAERAQLKPGDFILAVDGEKLRASGPEHEEEFAALIRQYDIGAKVELTVLRGKTENKVAVELERSPKLRREMKKYRNPEFEFTARDVAFFDVAEEQWPANQKGALVEEVQSGSWAELGSLMVDDLITQVDGQPVQNVDGLKRLMEQVTKEKKTSVILKVLRGIHTAYLELEPSWKQ